MNNPYYDELRKTVKPVHSGYRPYSFQSFTSVFDRGGFKEFRRDFVVKYAWAIPSAEAIRRIAEFCEVNKERRIVEIGAGTGYWAWMLQEAGVTVHAYDKYLKNNPYKHEKFYTELKKGSHNTLRKWNYDNRWTLLLCWPPYDDPTASRCLRRFMGRKLVYIGESEYGCTADQKFFEMLNKGWKHIESIDIPQWDGIHDYVQLYERK